MISLEKLTHSTAATKELVTIVMALASANAVSQFIAIPVKNKFSYMLLIGILLAVIRFYHGNVLAIDRYADVGAPKPLAQGISFFVVIAQSFLFTFMPYFFVKPKILLFLVGALFALDVLWWVPTAIWAPHLDRHEQVWATLALVGGVFIALMAVFAWSDYFPATIAFVLILTTILDYVINWQGLYFPS